MSKYLSVIRLVEQFRKNKNSIRNVFVILVVVTSLVSATQVRARIMEDGSGGGTGYGDIPVEDVPVEFQPEATEAGSVDIEVSYVTNGSNTRSPRQYNAQLSKTLWYGWNRGLGGNLYPQSNSAVSGYVAGLNDPNITIGYDIGIYDANNPTQLLAEGATVRTGDRVILKFGSYTSDNIFWFGTGYSMDSPYGEWRTGATAPPYISGNRVSCDIKDLVARYDISAGAGYGTMSFDVYVPFVVNPASRALSNLSGLTCDPIVRNDPYGTAEATCTVTATGGTITPHFDFGSTNGKFYYRYYDTRDMSGVGWGPADCYGNNIPMTDRFGSATGPEYNSVTGVDGGYSFPVPAVNFPYPLVVAPLDNDPPGAPTLTCPASANVGANISVTLRAIDPDGDQVRYGVDWPSEGDPNNTGSPTQNSGWTGLVNSNTSQILTKSGGYTAPGAYNIYGLAQDDNGANSSYASCTVNVVCAAGTSWNGSACIAVPFSCTGADPVNTTMCASDDQSLSANTPKTAVGACTAPVKCEFQCNSGYSFNGSTCVVNSCQGSIPANASAWSPSESNAPIAGGRSWTYASPETAQKCEFQCNAGYSWNGSACTVVVSPSLVMTANPGTAAADAVTNTAATNLQWTGANFPGGVNNCLVGWHTNPAAPWANWNILASSQNPSGARGAVQPVGTRYYRVGCPTQGAVSSPVSFTVTAPSNPDLSVYSDPTANGTLTQGLPVSFTGQVQNAGSVPITASFTNEFTYRWGTSGAWTAITPPVGGDIPQTYTSGSPFPAGNVTSDTSAAFTLTNSGTLQVQYCADSQLQITEGNEGNNCRISTFTINPGIGFSISASPNPIQVCAPDTYGTTTVTYTSPVNATIWAGSTAFANLGAGTHSADTGDWVNNGAVFTLREGTGASQGVERGSITVNTTTAGCVSQYDLTSNIDPVSIGTLEQGRNVTFRGEVRNSGSASVSGFSDNFTYRWGTTGGWTMFGSHISKSSLAVGAIVSDTSQTFSLTQTGTLQVQHCVDSLGTISESNEGDNCRMTSFNISGPAYSCTGTTPTNSTICSSDNTGLTSDTPKTVVNACSVPKCEYRCSAGYSAIPALNRCVSGTISASPSQVVSGGTSVVTWNVSGSTSGLTCTVAGGADNWTGTSGSQTSSPLSVATTYVLSCNGVAIAQTTVSLSAPPSLTADPRIVDLGTSASLTYDLNGNTSCTLTGGGLNQVLAAQTGTIATGALFGTTVYTITCGGVLASVTVEVREEGHET